MEAVKADESALVAALRAGDEPAFRQLVEAYTPGMRRLALTFVRTPALADDVVQEAWLGVLRGLDRFEGRATLRTWIYRIVANIARTRAVKEARSAPFSSLGDEPSVDPERFADGHWAEPPEPWRAVLDSEARALVDRAIAALPDQQRRVIQLRDVEGWGAVEVCNVLDFVRDESESSPAPSAFESPRRARGLFRRPSMRNTLSCQELVELVTDYLEGALSRRDRKRFDAHVADCEYCSLYLEQLRQTIALTGMLREEDVRPDARDALLAQFAQWKQERA